MSNVVDKVSSKLAERALEAPVVKVDEAKLEEGRLREAENAKMEALRRKVSTLRTEALFNRRALASPKPDKSYVWVNIKEERQIFFQAMGWQICKDPDVGSRFWNETHKAHVCADVILYEMDRDLAEAFEADAVVRGYDNAGRNTEANFNAAVRKVSRQYDVNIPTFKPKV